MKNLLLIAILMSSLLMSVFSTAKEIVFVGDLQVLNESELVNQSGELYFQIYMDNSSSPPLVINAQNVIFLDRSSATNEEADIIIKNGSPFYFSGSMGQSEGWINYFIIRFVIIIVFLILLFGIGFYILNSKDKSVRKEISENLKIKHFMTRTIISIDENAFIKEAVLLLVRHNLGSLVVTRDEKPIGIITERDIFKKPIIFAIMKSKQRVSKYMSVNMVKGKPDDLVFNIEQMMFKNKIRRVPIEKNGEIVGIVTSSDLLGIWNESTEAEVLKHIKLLDQKLKVWYWMTTELVEVDLYETLEDAYEIMYQKGVSSVVVMDAQRPVGILTERDIITKHLLYRVNLKKTVIKDMLKRQLISIEPDLEIFEAAKIMHTNHIKRLPIIEDSVLVGLISATDLVRAWAKISRKYE